MRTLNISLLPSELAALAHVVRAASGLGLVAANFNLPLWAANLAAQVVRHLAQSPAAEPTHLVLTAEEAQVAHCVLSWCRENAAKFDGVTAGLWAVVDAALVHSAPVTSRWGGGTAPTRCW